MTHDGPTAGPAAGRFAAAPTGWPTGPLVPGEQVVTEQTRAAWDVWMQVARAHLDVLQAWLQAHGHLLIADGSRGSSEALSLKLVLCLGDARGTLSALGRGAPLLHQVAGAQTAAPAEEEEETDGEVG